MYHAGSTNDTSTAMDHIRQQYKGEEIFALGFSMGSNLLVKYMAERGDRCEFKAAMSICNPFNFVICNERIERKLFGAYSYAMTTNLKRKLYEHQHSLASFLEHHHDGDDIQTVCDKINTMEDYDVHVTCKMFGFDDPTHYYTST